jgi:ubiquinone/menaquinone biosynthesis C-methylase UbiE
MKQEWSENDLREIAGQLGNPTGEGGVKTANAMNRSNMGMISRATELLVAGDHDRVLEIGPGNGLHVADLVKSASNLTYTGIDISETMINEAIRLNGALVVDGTASFVLTDGLMLPFPDHSFDRIFTVNTIYFWRDPAGYAREIARVLRPGGKFVLAFAVKSFMEKLPFTSFGFTLYDKEPVEKLVLDAGLFIHETVEELDFTLGNLGQSVEREVVFVVCGK